MTRIDWDLIRDDFVKSSLDYGMLAKKYSVSRASIELKASPKNESWQLLREEFRRNNQSQNQPGTQTKTLLHSSIRDESNVEVLAREKLTHEGVQALVDSTLLRLAEEIQHPEVQVRSLEKAVDSLTKLIELRMRVNPPTVKEWIFEAMQLGLPAQEVYSQLRTALE